jgi:RND family efflux transporter MFP subunit
MSFATRLSVAGGFILLASGAFWAFTNVPDPTTKSAPTNVSERVKPAATVAPDRQRTQRPADEPLDYVGVTLPNRTVTVVSETQGRVMQVLAKTGQAVRAGQPLAVADTYLKQLAVTTAQAQLAQVRWQAEQATRQAERLRALVAERNAPALDLENAQSQLRQLEVQQTQAQAQLDQVNRQLTDATVRVPATGILTERSVEPGTVLQPGTELGKVVDISTLKVRILVPEQEIFRLRVGQTAHLTPDALPSLSLTGRITLIGIVADEVRNFPVEITLPNPGGRLKAGQSVRVVMNDK